MAIEKPNQLKGGEVSRPRERGPHGTALREYKQTISLNQIHREAGFARELY